MCVPPSAWQVAASPLRNDFRPDIEHGTRR